MDRPEHANAASRLGYDTGFPLFEGIGLSTTALPKLLCHFIHSQGVGNALNGALALAG